MVVKMNLNPKVPSIPHPKDLTKVDVRYMVIDPYVSIHIYWDPKIAEIVYSIEEPLMSEELFAKLEDVKNAMREVVNINLMGKDRTPEALLDYVDKTARLIISELGYSISEADYNKMIYYLYRDFIGLNEIEGMMKDYYIEDVECNGVNEPMYVVHRIFRNIRTTTRFTNMDNLSSFVEKLAQKTGRHISYASPILDGSLPDGSRVNATYTKDVTSKGPTFCFKKGKVQLGNGEVVEVEKLFEDAKKRFGSKIEKGNEVVQPKAVSICAVNEHTLKQNDSSQITSVIKLPGPKELVRVEFADGGEIETTKDHLFHVAGNSLVQVEAQELKKGMFCPIPIKIEAQGYRQKIDVHRLIKDFSYSYKTCVYSNPQIKQYVQAEITGAGKNHRNLLARKYGVGQSYFYEVLSRGNSVSFNVLDKLCTEQNIDFSTIEDLQIGVYGGGTKGKTKAVDVPKVIDENLAYLAGALVSDGNLHENHINFACYEETFADSVSKKLEKLFGKSNAYYEGNRVYLCNKFVPYLFNQVFEIPYGKKSRTVRVPQVIFKSDNKVVSKFLQGLFDGDGTVKAGLSYKTFSKELAEGVSYLLARLGIYSYIKKEGEALRVGIPSPYYHRFLTEVGFNSAHKLFELGKVIQRQVDHKAFIRHNRVPSKPFLELLQKAGIGRKEIIRRTGVSYNRLYYESFSRSFAAKIYEELISCNKAADFKEELSYLHWLLETPQEFVKIKSVETVANTQAIYDIELDPEKYFIAGNKPMNVFDTIRKFTKTPWTPTQLIGFHTLSPEMLAYFWLALQYQSNVMIVGGTASGKTTLLNAISFFIPPENRVVSIEDTRELNLPRENWLPSVVRSGVSGKEGGVGDVGMFELLKGSFRQNPDYVIVGEVRGKEASVLFQGMGSGHASISTMHADSVQAVVRRLTTPPISLSPMLVNGLDIVVIMTHAIVDGKETRRLREVSEVVNVVGDGTAEVNTPFKWDPGKDAFFFNPKNKVFEKIREKMGISEEDLQKEFVMRTKLLYEMFRNKVLAYEEVQRVVNEYQKNPDAVLERFGLKEKTAVALGAAPAASGQVAVNNAAAAQAPAQTRPMSGAVGQSPAQARTAIRRPVIQRRV